MMKKILAGVLSLSAAYALDGCIVAARPGVYSPAYYGYSTYAAPNTVYYQGGYHSGTYYQAGYYHRTAPFFGATVVTAPQTVYAAPQTVYTSQPVYQQPTTVYQQPTYQRPAYQQGVSVGGQVGVGSSVGVGASGGVGVGVRIN